MDDVIKLISQAFVKDKYGVSKPTLVYNEIFCQIHSVTKQEFYDAGRRSSGI